MTTSVDRACAHSHPSIPELNLEEVQPTFRERFQVQLDPCAGGTSSEDRTYSSLSPHSPYTPPARSNPTAFLARFRSQQNLHKIGALRKVIHSARAVAPAPPPPTPTFAGASLDFTDATTERALQQPLIHVAFRLIPALAQGAIESSFFKGAAQGLQSAPKLHSQIASQRLFRKPLYQACKEAHPEAFATAQALLLSDPGIGPEIQEWLAQLFQGVWLSKTLTALFDRPLTDWTDPTVLQALQTNFSSFEDPQPSLLELGPTGQRCDPLLLDARALQQLFSLATTCRHLILRNLVIPEWSLHHLAQCQELEHLELDHCSFSTLRPLSLLSNLDHLSLTHCRGSGMTSESLKELGHLSLRSLEIENIPELSEAWLASLPKTLESLSLLYPNTVSSRPFKGLSRLKLRALRVLGGPFSKYGWSCLKTESLKTLRLDFNPHLNLFKLRSLLKRCDALEYLDLGNSLSLSTTFSRHRTRFWDSLFKKGSTYALKHLRIGDSANPLAQHSRPSISLLSKLFPGLQTFTLIAETLKPTDVNRLRKHMPHLQNLNFLGNLELCDLSPKLHETGLEVSVGPVISHEPHLYMTPVFLNL